MKSTILLLALATAALSSCTTAYKTGQTPDDVYFSPAPPQDEYVQVQKKDERKYRNDEEYYDDRYLRMKVQNRTQWSDLNDWYYYDNRYNYSSYNNWNNPWSPSNYWNYYYNPYCTSCCVISTGTGKNHYIVYDHPRTFNLNTYNSMALTNNNYNNGKVGGNINMFGGLKNTTPAHNNHNTGNFLRNIFNGNDNNNNSSSNNSSGTKPSTSSGSNSGSSSGSSSSGSSAPVRRF